MAPLAPPIPTTVAFEIADDLVGLQYAGATIPSLQHECKVVLAMDTIFGLPCKRALGISYQDPLFRG